MIYVNEHTREKSADIYKLKLSETDRMQINEKLPYQAILLENVSDAIISTDLNFNIKSWNKAAETIYGWKAEEVIGKPVAEVTQLEYPYDQEDDVVEQFFEKGFWRGEVIQKRKDNTPLSIQASVSLIKDNTGKPIGAVAVNRDISERKKAEAALRESEEKFRLISEQTLMGIAIVQDNIIKYVNEACEKICEYSLKEFVNSGIDIVSKIIHPDDLSLVMEQLQKKQLGEKDVISRYSIRLITKTRNIKWIELYSKAIMFKGKPADLVAMIDATDCKIAEEGLKESEERFRNLAEQSPNMIFVNQKGRIMYANNVCQEVMGYTKKEFYSSNFNFMSLIAPESRGVVSESYRAHMEGKELDPYEYTLVTKDGKKIEAIISTKLIRYGGDIAILGIVTDITNRKQAEREMRRQLMKFNLKEGDIYLVKEATSNTSAIAFHDLLKVEYQGLMISRDHPEKVKGFIPNDFEYRWITERGNDTATTISPRLEEIERLIDNLPQTQAILIGRLDYLISKTGFVKTLSFVQHLKEIAYFKKHIVILSIDPFTLQNIELRQLEKEAKELEPRQKIRLPEDWRQILQFVYEENLKNNKPSYSEIATEIRISKPTVRKKIRELTKYGYLKESQKGRSKIVEFTERSGNLFSK